MKSGHKLIIVYLKAVNKKLRGGKKELKGWSYSAKCPCGWSEAMWVHTKKRKLALGFIKVGYRRHLPGNDEKVDET